MTTRYSSRSHGVRWVNEAQTRRLESPSDPEEQAAEPPRVREPRVKHPRHTEIKLVTGLNCFWRRCCAARTFWQRIGVWRIGQQSKTGATVTSSRRLGGRTGR